MMSSTSSRLDNFGKGGIRSEIKDYKVNKLEKNAN